MRALLNRFIKDRRGVAAVEFAICAPVAIGFYFLVAEMNQGFMAKRRIGHATSAVGDLVAQSAQVNSADMTDIFAIAKTIMAPFPTTSLKLRVTSITANSSGVVKVDWSDASGMTALTKGATVTVPTGLIAAGESLVMSESAYTFTSPVGELLPTPTQFTRKIYLKPRKSSVVIHN